MYASRATLCEIIKICLTSSSVKWNSFCRLAWYEWFSFIKAKTERFTAASSRCRQNLKYENFTSSFSRLRKNIASKSVPHVQHHYFSLFNQSNHWFVALSLTLLSSNLKLPTKNDGNGNDDARKHNLIGWMRKNNRAARAARTLVAFFDVVCQITTWNLLLLRF